MEKATQRLGGAVRINQINQMDIEDNKNMVRAIYQRPLADLNWTDFEEIVARGLEEDQTLEFKEMLPAKDGGADPWQAGRDKVGDYARDALAHEIVAFANAYGGVVIVGIAETNDNPRRAREFNTPLVRNCVECVERLGPALRSRVDPPITGFEIRAIPKPDANGDGIIVIRVPSSSIAPHGVGRPPSAYIRRGSSAEPLTMRDLQNVFWEARTRRERVQEMRRERQESLLELEKAKIAGRVVRSIDRQPVPADTPHLMFRCSAIPEQPLGLSGLALKLSRDPLALPGLRKKDQSIPQMILGWGHLTYGWRPKAHGARAEVATSKVFGYWELGDDGFTEVAAITLEDNNEHAPEWFSPLVAQVLLMAERLRLLSARPDIPLVVDAEFRHDGTAVGVDWRSHRKTNGLERSIRIGPFVASNRADIAKVYDEFEREIWAGFGIANFVRSEIDFDLAFKDYLNV